MAHTQSCCITVTWWNLTVDPIFWMMFAARPQASSLSLCCDMPRVKRNYLITLWLLNIAMENGPFIDGLPIKNGDFPWLC
jgi:hypothetical protein